MVIQAVSFLLACQVFCVGEGFESGFYKEKKCECTQSYFLEDILTPKLKLRKEEPGKKRKSDYDDF